MASSDLRPVRPTVTPAAYVGGKRNLAKRICAIIESIPHQTYAECFVGMGGIFLRRSSAPPAEVINDYSGDVANLFRILQRHYPQFMDMLKYQVSSRREFERLKECDPATLTDLERAGRFLYMQRLSFGGRVNGHFGIDPARGGRFNILKLAPLLEEIHERLAGVVIENRRWQDFMDLYDRPGTLFYLDPPYFGCEDDYGKELFDRAEFAEMAARLARLKGRFILSINDLPEIRELFSAFDIIPVELTYTIAGGRNARPARELIIVGRAV
ncbi:DNA adenine methylase [Nitratireductor soli]|uniref:DNA adenine methylase n=1 Tax=Nitratireductor soli TaxID=1670619 RepID=UPI00065E3430|nr:DNA adenine methylase [Nitratireductor soli]